MKKNLLTVSIIAGLSINFINAEYLYNFKAEILKDIVVENTNNSIPCDDEHNVCFLGEKSSNDLVSGIQLASHINLTQGTDINTTAGWLHYVIDGKELYVAKVPFKHSVSWLDVYNTGSVFGGQENIINDVPNVQERVAQNATITINNINYKVRLLGCTTETQSPLLTSTGDVVDFKNSEFNRLLYRVSSNVYAQQIGNNFETTFNPSTELGFNNGAGRGTICMDYNGDNTVQTRGRTSYGMAPPYVYSRTQSSSAGGWRPVLERIN